MQKNYENKIVTIPNLLTLLRLLLIPVIVYLYCFEKSYNYTAVVLIMSGITDLVDGFIARTFYMTSNLGKIIDPIADKLTQFVVLICLVTRFPTMLIPSLILLAKELISGFIAMCAIKKSGKVDGADWHGKVSTFMLYAMMILHVLWIDIPSVVSNGFITVCTVMMVISFVLYTIRNWTVYKEFKDKERRWLMKNEFCIYASPISIYNSNLKKIDAANRFGMKAVECFNNAELSSPDEEAARRIKEYADKNNIKIPCLSVYTDVSFDYEQTVENLKGYARVAKILGSPYLHHTIISECSDPDKVLSQKDELYDLGIKAVREVYDYAESIGIKTVYEDQGYIFNGINGFKKFTEDVKRDIGVVADFGNIYEADDCITDFIKTFGDKICHVHIKDMKIAEKEPKEQCMLKTLGGKFIIETEIGKGSVDISGGLEELKKINYDGYLSLEFCAFDDNPQTYIDQVETVGRILKQL